MLIQFGIVYMWLAYAPFLQLYRFEKMAVAWLLCVPCREKEEEAKRQAQTAEDQEAAKRKEHATLHILDQACPRYFARPV